MPHVTSASVSAASGSSSGLESSSDFTKLASLPGPWIVVSVPSDTTDVQLSDALNGDTDGGYEIDFESAPTSDTSTQYSLNVGVDGGSASATGCTSVTNFGNGISPGSTPQLRLDVLTGSSVGTSQAANASIMLEAARTTFPRKYIALGVRLTPGSTSNIASWYTQGTYQATGNITTLTLHASTANGFKAGSIVRYRKVNS